MKLVDRVKGLLLAPTAEWRVIAREYDGPMARLIDHVAVLAALPAIADFIGMALIGFALPSGTVVRIGIVPALLIVAFDYGMAVVIVAALATIMHAAAPLFGAGRDFPNALKLAVYSYTPAWLAGIFLLVPGLHFLVMLGLYGFVLLFRGMPVLLRAPAGMALPFAAAVTACAVIIVLVIGAARAKIFSLPGIL